MADSRQATRAGPAPLGGEDGKPETGGDDDPNARPNAQPSARADAQPNASETGAPEPGPEAEGQGEPRGQRFRKLAPLGVRIDRPEDQAEPAERPEAEEMPPASRGIPGIDMDAISRQLAASSAAARRQAAEADPAPAEAAETEAQDDEESDGDGKGWNIAPSAVNFEDPLLICLSIVASLIQRPISEQALRAGLPHAGDRFTPELTIQAAERAGLGARLVRRGRVKDISALTLPCIVLLKGGNAAVLTRYPDKASAEVVMPEGGGAQTIPLEILEEDYTGYAIFLRADFKFDARSSEVRLTQPKAWFWGTIGKFWPIYNHVILASVLINCFAIASPLFIMNVYDRVVPNNALETLWVLALGVCIVFVFEFVMRNMRTYFVDTAGKNADVIIASRLLEQVMAMRLDKKPPSTGALANNLRDFESLREFFTSGTLVAFVDLPFIFLFIAVIWLVAGSVALIPLLVVPLVVIVGALLQFPLRRVIEKTHREQSQKHALLFETIEGVETIKSIAAEGRVQRAWERFVGMTARSSAKAAQISGLASTLAQVSIQLTTVAVVVYGVHKIALGEITMGALIAATILTGRALQPLGAVSSLLTRLQQSRVALKALDTIMKTPIERDPAKSFLHRPRLGGEIAFKNVSFAYPGNDEKVLHGVSFSIQPGEKIGILGRIGSGKSTLARLLLGLYEPAEGSVLVDGTDNRQIDPADLRRNIGYVSQDNYLFFGSVRENISFGSPHVDEQTVLRAAELAGVTDFLQGHPMGFDLQVGERGTALSGGQRQSVVIARSLLLDPPILMLDEPTSSMDNASEAQFKARLQQVLPDKTMLLVTHRGSMLSLVDRLIVIDHGKIVADGPKDEVLKALRSGSVRSGGRNRAPAAGDQAASAPPAEGAAPASRGAD